MDHDLTEEPYEEDNIDDNPLAGVDGVSLASAMFVVFQCHCCGVALPHTAALVVRSFVCILVSDRSIAGCAAFFSTIYHLYTIPSVGNRFQKRAGVIRQQVASDLSLYIFVVELEYCMYSMYDT